MTASQDMIRGRSNVVTLTNKSGGALVAGDVCVIDTSNDEAVTTTTSAASVLKVYIAAESIANDATGKFYSAGFCPLVTPSASVTRGRYLFTHTAAKQAAESATYGAGAFGVILKSGTTPSVWLFGSTAQGSGGGAPTTTPYVTTAADGGLSAEVVIPGLAGSADIAGAAGAGVSYEFDSGSLPTWTSAVAAEDINTTFKSHYYASVTDNTERLSYFAWSPAGAAAFDARAKMTGGINIASGFNFGLIIMNSDNSTRAVIQIAHQIATPPYYTSVQAFTYASSTYTQRGVNWQVNPVSPVYYRITRDGSNNLTFWYGADGIGWQTIAVQALTFTVARIGFRISGGSAATSYLACDWLRTNV